MQSAHLQKNISTATNNSTLSNSSKGGISLPAVPVYQQKPIQKMELEEKQPIQGKFIIQRKELEEQLPLQPKFKILSSAPTEPKPFQRFVLPKSNEPEAVKAPIQRFVLPTQHIQKKANNTGLPETLKSGIENLSGYSMDDVKVHYNSDKPTQLQAHAYAQGTDIHLATGQEKHLPHEAWHIVQQKQGRVRPTMQMKGKVNINDDAGLEKEADVMGAKAFQFVDNRPEAIVKRKFHEVLIGNPVQLKQSIITQRQKITENEALEELANRCSYFNKGNTKITTPWGDEDSNCHGYTLNNKTGFYADPEELLPGIRLKDKIAVFMKGNVIAHSGFNIDNSLTHFLIGIGICNSKIGLTDTAGYDHRYNLPNDRKKLYNVLKDAKIEATRNERRVDVGSLLGYAKDYGISIYEDVTFDFYDCLENIDKDEFIKLHSVKIKQIRERVNAYIKPMSSGKEATLDKRRNLVEEILKYAKDNKISIYEDVTFDLYEYLLNINKDAFIKKNLVKLNQIREAVNKYAFS